MKRKLKAYIFRQAAERIDGDIYDYCCPAISRICNQQKQDRDPYRKFFELFKPNEKEWHRIGDGMHYSNIKEVGPYCIWWTPQDNQARVLALLLCAEMIKNP
jgi:hypothetical protein